MKYLYLVADGMGDWPLDGLGGRTPLEAAHTPEMDKLAATSLVGQCQTIPHGMEPGSDIANMALMGYDPARYHTGRGPIEAAAQGLETGPKDLIWRMNLVTLDSENDRDIMRDYSGGHVETEDARKLIDSLADAAPGGMAPVTGVQYRHLLVHKDGAQTPAAEVSIRPPHDILDKDIAPDIEAYSAYKPLSNFWNKAREILAGTGNPTAANAIWPWGQGTALSIPDFSQTHGLSGAVISAVDLVRGLGRAAGMHIPEVQGVTGLVDTNYQGKVDAALDFLERGDFAFVHLEGPDECGHMGDPGEKIRAIENFDQKILGRLLEAVSEQDLTIVVCCDHLTPIKIRTHAPDPVPFMIHFSKKSFAGVDEFSERTAASTGVFLRQGTDILQTALKGDLA
jgi:2,3-bisphosphoglycerate-independent phosphoglycerate mutase